MVWDPRVPYPIYRLNATSHTDNKSMIQVWFGAEAPDTYRLDSFWKRSPSIFVHRFLCVYTPVLVCCPVPIGMWDLCFYHDRACSVYLCVCWTRPSASQYKPLVGRLFGKLRAPRVPRPMHGPIPPFQVPVGKPEAPRTCTVPGRLLGHLPRI